MALRLDVGCGVNPHGNINCDIRKLYGIRSFVQCDVNYLPFRNQAFSKVLISNVLEHMEDPEHILRECLRVGSSLEVVVDSLWNPLNWLHPAHAWLTLSINGKVFFLKRPRWLKWFSKWFYQAVYGNQEIYKTHSQDRVWIIEPWLERRRIKWRTHA